MQNYGRKTMVVKEVVKGLSQLQTVTMSDNRINTIINSSITYRMGLGEPTLVNANHIKEQLTTKQWRELSSLVCTTLHQ